ncbi:hypothetical protein EVG20_g5084 [Dentipellis fragilis]|uniref:Decapping nuclease n=1 Tax=Dentipellis fragilis TaxID=205917 RepID=A0A4Y9YWF7_9AGAM|nr:hypothetical protein EVG20_g5084 [Dentipellis fragilis]
MPHLRANTRLYVSPYRRDSPPSPLTPGCNLQEDLIISTPIKTLSVPITSSEIYSTKILNAEHIGSYNSTSDQQPTIIVPAKLPTAAGSPPEWIGHAVPFTLPPDLGPRSSQNNHCNNGSPLLPLMKAVDAIGAAVDWPNVDVVADRNALRKLLWWINKAAQAEDFRIDIELGGDHTLLMSRWRANVTYGSGDWRTFGFGFEESTTRNVKGCEKSTGHYRIIKYDFFGLRMVVRYEVDAYIPSALPAKTKGNSASEREKPTSLAFGEHANNDANTSVSAPLASGTLTSPPLSSRSVDTLDIVHAGREIPQSSIIELTTRSQHFIELLNWPDLYPRLYLSRTRFLCIGLHSHGRFGEIRQYDMARGMETQYNAVRGALQKLGQVLTEIQDLMEENPGRRLSLVCEGGVLRVYERATSKSCLPEDVMKRFVAV